MEGKAEVLFKKFANIDCFDIEIKKRSSKDFRHTLQPTFGALEDIKPQTAFLLHFCKR